MEIKVNIPQNDYVQPTEVREEVVQAICNAFLSNSCWDIFHPFKGDAKKYADTAIKVAEKLRYLWFSWTMGFRLNNLLNVDVVYGKDEIYSVVSNT